ncbi:hypothetical protein OCH239_06100 [Roseivivax halodurans JCM 10272]|uniref:Uncharacterized protein n=1 Tax=Roseivivax halodurans JCM 10272 TaxID=1449350 RepID=X7ECW3_9RHOB|nr:PRC-barrel domain-containing protein [Roseivivax halodurans]ETX13889.1 hypothetical protein OCH239_06100 [Roseivivax halodurans JCM 10272]
MKTSLQRLLLSTALTIPAMAGPALAQSSDQPCEELGTMIENGIPEDVSMTEEDLRSVVEDGEAEACETQLTQLEDAMSEQDSDQASAEDSDEATAEAEAQVAEREQTTIQIDEERVVEGIVRLQREAPQVDVEEGEAQVTVQGGNPEVSVEQQQPEITVRQPQATVTMEMQQPTITIDQPAPEIIITMPDPNVNVANAEPQVDVQQGEPTISVSQAPPQVNLDLRVVENADATGEGVQVEDEQSGTSYAEGEAQELQPLDNAQVNVTQSEPQITYEQASNSDGGESSSDGSNATVNVTSAGQPTVNYESSEPQIDFSMAGEPQIQFNQSGEPKVTMQTGQSENGEQSNSDQSDASNSDQQQSSGDDQQTAEAQSGDMQSDDQQNAESQASDTQSTDQETADAQSAEAQSEDAQMASDQSGDMQSGDEQSADAATSGSGLDIQVDGYEAVAASEVNNDMLTDTALYNQENERIGDIDEVVTGDGSGIERIVVAVGGFLGLGERQVALNLDEMQVMQATEGDDVRVYTNMTREELENMERYEG